MKRRKITSGSKKERLIHEKSRSLLEKGNECLAKGKNDEAVAYYNEAIDYLEPYKDDISFYKAYISGLYKNLGQALIKVNRRNDALRIFDKALQLDPKNVDFWVSRGEVLVLLSSTMQDEAMRSFDSALNIEPKGKRALDSKGEAFERMNEPEKAKECYLSIIDFYPEELEFYDKILRLTPDDKSVWLRKGQVLDQKDKHEEALICYDKALEIDPKDKKLWSSRALSLGKLECFMRMAH
jgi:tetratricopeptide (TPR) repeat protein